ncbi:ribokinase [Streptomyces sp. NPDC003300]|uniref:ribokinase n=1 Tax=unclassified Streptomyces TaxID=2593676 RepID=UPI0033A90BDC
MGRSTADGVTLLVVGSANADLVVRVDRHPAPGETVLGTSGVAVHAGGKGANQAVAAGRLGARVGFCGRVGVDAYGERLTAELRSAAVDTTALGTEKTVPTGIALITVAADGENAIVVVPGANTALTAAEVTAAVGPAVRVVSAQCEVPMDAVRAAARAAERHGARLVLNPSPPEAVRDDAESGQLLSCADPLVVNEHEMRVLLGAASAAEADPRDLLRLGVRSAVVTMGGAGVTVVERQDVSAGGREDVSGGVREDVSRDVRAGVRENVRADAEPPRGRTTRLPAVPVEVVDTTGAGDAFTGALAWRLAEGDGLVEAAGWAVRVGAAAVGESGAQLSSTACGKLLAESEGGRGPDGKPAQDSAPAAVPGPGPGPVPDSAPASGAAPDPGTEEPPA